MQLTKMVGWQKVNYKLAKYSVQLHGMINDTDNLESLGTSKDNKSIQLHWCSNALYGVFEVNDYPIIP